MRHLRAVRRHLLLRHGLAAVVLSVILGLAASPAAAIAGGPGVTIFSARSIQPVTLSGNQIAAAADTPPTRYTIRSSSGGSGSSITLRGLSVGGMLALAGISPSRFISVVRADGSLLVLTRADISGSSFPQGPALVTDEGGSTRFFKPGRGGAGANPSDNVVTSGASGPLEITVDGGTLLPVEATASTRQTATGKTVTFRARTQFAPSGASLTYEWNFGDEGTATGATVRHAFRSPGGQAAQVSVRGTGGSRCTPFCGGVATVVVIVGDSRGAPGTPEDITPGSGSGNPDAPGSSTGTGGGGDGQGGPGGAGGVTDALRKIEESRARSRRQEAARARRVRRARQGERERAAQEKARDVAVRPDAALPITGIVIADAGTVVSRLPALRAAAGAVAPKGVQATRGGSPETLQLRLGLALALAIAALGALREGRRVRLRVA